MRVIVAGRLSRKVHDRDQSGLDSQERESVRWAEFNGHTVVAVLADYKTGRAGLEARRNLRPWVTEPAKLAQFDGIVALKVDRLTRGDRAETAKLETWARQHHKALLIAGSSVHFPAEGMDGAMWDFELRKAHQEWLDISERYSRMQRTRREDGSHIGRVPYGLCTVPAVNDQGRTIKALAIVAAEAEVIRDAARGYLAGDSLQAVCDRLNAAGRLPRQPKPEDGAPFGRLRNGRPRTGPVRWVPKTLSGALRSEACIGRVDNGHGYTLKVTPILDRATWQAAKARMDARANRAGVKWGRNTALLTGIIECARCGRKMYRNGSATKLYWCHGCNAHLALADADRDVRELVALNDRHPEIETVVPGNDHAEEIADVKDDMAEAVAAEDFGRLDGLRARLDGLRALPVILPHVETRTAAYTVAEAWAALPDDSARRRWLLDHKASVTYDDGELTICIGDWVMVNVDRPAE